MLAAAYGYVVVILLRVLIRYACTAHSLYAMSVATLHVVDRDASRESSVPNMVEQSYPIIIVVCLRLNCFTY